eukprot:bmy_08346T0
MGAAKKEQMTRNTLKHSRSTSHPEWIFRCMNPKRLITNPEQKVSNSLWGTTRQSFGGEGPGRGSGTHLGHDGGQVDVLVELPAIQAALLLQLLQVHVAPRLQPERREVDDRREPVAAAAVRHLAAVLQLQREAVVAPHAAQVRCVRHPTVVLRGRRQEHGRQAVEAVGDDAGAEQEENEALEWAPLAQEGGHLVVVPHAALSCQRGARPGDLDVQTFPLNEYNFQYSPPQNAKLTLKNSSPVNEQNKKEKERKAKGRGRKRRRRRNIVSSSMN